MSSYRPSARRAGSLPLLSNSAVFAAFGALASASLLVPDALAQEPSSPLETIIVIGRPPEAGAHAVVVQPQRSARLATLPDLFAGTPGVLAQTNFGGVDHPRLSIRGSGLQRGTQPAGRGVELRLEGLPMTYADTSFDFVEWIEPLAFDRVIVLRGGRAELVGGAALGGVIDFHIKDARAPDASVLRLEAGSYGAERAQAAFGAAGEALEAYASASWYAQDGERQFAAQEAARVLASGAWTPSPATRVSANLVYSDSEVELPGPLTQAAIEQGSQSAQSANVAGDWRRFTERARLALGVDTRLGEADLSVKLGHMGADVEFRRRDVQVEDNDEWQLEAALGGDLGAGRWAVSYLGQRGERSVQQYLNGGGTPPSFTGARGLMWADNELLATRQSLSAALEFDASERLSLHTGLAYNAHTREIEERFPTRAERPAAVLDETYDELTGLALVSFDVAPDTEVFGAYSHTHEPPTWDVLLVNANGVGVGASLVNGANPRRPLVASLDDQIADTIEIGARGRAGALSYDVTLYHSVLDGEIVSTTDPVTQTVSSVGNADQTTRWGLEAFAEFRATEALTVSATWTWTDARFDDDARFGDNHLPIVPEHVVGLSADYRFASGLFAAARAEIVPDGGYADYANTLQAEGYATLGLRAGWERDRVLLFVEGRNVTDEAYVSTIVAAQNNLAGADNATFAPGEGAQVLFGVEARY